MTWLWGKAHCNYLVHRAGRLFEVYIPEASIAIARSGLQVTRMSRNSAAAKTPRIARNRSPEG
jgi:hypothetical protein